MFQSFTKEKEITTLRNRSIRQIPLHDGIARGQDKSCEPDTRIRPVSDFTRQTAGDKARAASRTVRDTLLQAG